MIITDHAYKRLKNRTGLNKSAFDKLIENAEQHGIRKNDTTGKLRRYFDSLHHTYNQPHIIIYNNFVFICKANNLITIFPAPHNIQKLVKNINKEK